MLHRLSTSERTVSELATPFKMSLAGASKHIKVLEAAGLVRRHIQGRTHICTLRAARMAEAQEWLRYYEQFWEERLDDLEDILRAEDRALAERANHEPRRVSKSKPDTKEKNNEPASGK